MVRTGQVDWLERAKQGDPAVLAELFESHYNGVFRYLYYRVGDQHTAEDLASEVFLRMIAALPRYLPQQVAFRAWVYQIARNLSIDYFRATNRHPQVQLQEDLAVEHADPLRIVEKGLTTEKLYRALGQLPDHQRDVVILRFISGLPIGEVARTLHKSEDSIKGLQRRALSALRNQLIEWEVTHVQL